ncbi:nucleotidyl transferase AbiEii/AbiGii toxin family protein [Serratia marcescens]|uniref:nucleotidyl transferase AbiEii/AbiGii toxin family protein n=1 Tax=Serratia marcescens TaxID=615 RepID=UPI0021BD23C1|nr:nucleotidyl transferase AbiEii/AbiGii toxin family protein [Serratia marcescens]
MSDLTTLFPDVADAMGIESVSIIEKDYYVVELLRLLSPLSFESHQLVFAGGTALSKAGISLNRMSEDVDIKLVPTSQFCQQAIRTQRKKTRKAIINNIIDAINRSGIFSFDPGNPKVTRDEYRYNEIPIRYPQTHTQAPCLRPFIKLELIETDLLEPAENRDISSFVTDSTGKGEKVKAFPCATVASTHAEKLISMLRRTAASLRDIERGVDEALVRHVYDNYYIAKERNTELAILTQFVQMCIQQDIERYGNQYTQFCASPLTELREGLDELGRNPIHEERYKNFVSPMVFGEHKLTWEEAYACFRETASSVLNTITTDTQENEARV